MSEENKKAEINKDLASKIEEVSDTQELKQKKKNHWLWILGILLGLLLAGAVATYFVHASQYRSVYFGGTVINGMDVSYRTPAQVHDMLSKLCQDYALTLHARGRDDSVITAEEIGLHYETDDSPERILANQSIYAWYFRERQPREYEVPCSLAVDTTALEDRLNTLSCFDDASAQPCENAYLGPYDPAGHHYPVIPEVYGNRIIAPDSAKARIRTAIMSLAEDCDLEKGPEEIYELPEVFSNDVDIQTEKLKLDRLVGCEIVFKDMNEVLDGDTIKDWIIADDKGNYIVNPQKIASYSEYIADLYTTKDKPREFVTSYGVTTFIEPGTYGRTVDPQKEQDELSRLIAENAKVSRSPEFEGVALETGRKDWGDTYIEVNIGKQHLWYYKDGQLVVESDVVTGRMTPGRKTPPGAYYIYAMQRSRTLRGQLRPDGTYEYESYVEYWMPINRGIGLHDASWRGSFGGTIYINSGSHGCINLPPKVAKTIYNDTFVNCPVFLYDLKQEDLETLASEQGVLLPVPVQEEKDKKKS